MFLSVVNKVEHDSFRYHITQSPLGNVEVRANKHLDDFDFHAFSVAQCSGSFQNRWRCFHHACFALRRLRLGFRFEERAKEALFLRWVDAQIFAVVESVDLPKSGCRFGCCSLTLVRYDGHSFVSTNEVWMAGVDVRRFHAAVGVSSHPRNNKGEESLLDDIGNKLVRRLHSLLVEADDSGVEAVLERRIPFEVLLGGTQSVSTFHTLHVMPYLHSSPVADLESAPIHRRQGQHSVEKDLPAS